MQSDFAKKLCDNIEFINKKIKDDNKLVMNIIRAFKYR